ncbi:MFS transporter [Actinomycetospora sp. NBRC 106375]|uniref:MFS transporter n=1 Tax=Actinomycetospora sp. NBRC 106375 TaxID=3032207 RepID=UPI0024A3068B|nr:MFS transporter [Actinomycetospora sp. NBRC 106375]GLZ44857.1 MFS transporter [Actinomycetospora sp. NBRC 106375]
MTATEGPARYVRLARVPGVLSLGAASAVARLPLGMTGLALLLLVQVRTGSYQQAGAAVGCFALASAAGSPARGRLADRFAPVPVLLVTGVAQPVALVGVVVATASARPHPAPVLLAVALAGLLVPPVGPVSRAVWQRLVTAPDLARAAFALDSLLLQLIFYVVAPPVVAVLATSADPAVAVIAIAVLTVIGNVAVAASPAVRSVPRRRGSVHLLGPLTEPRLIVVLLTSTVAAAAFAALEVAVASAAVSRGATGASGLLLALIGVGSIAGGLFYGARSPAVSMAAQYRRWLVVLAMGTAPLVVATTTPVLGVLLVAAGLAIGPVSTSQFTLVGELAPTGTLTEAFTWLFSAALGGTALGSYLAGTATQQYGVEIALALPCALALATLGLAVAVRGASTTPEP